MTNQAIIPIILCSGSGTRLWPLSRKLSKQFLNLKKTIISLYFKIHVKESHQLKI